MKSRRNIKIKRRKNKTRNRIKRTRKIGGARWNRGMNGYGSAPNLNISKKPSSQLDMNMGYDKGYNYSKLSKIHNNNRARIAKQDEKYNKFNTTCIIDQDPQPKPNEYRLTQDNNIKTIEYFTGTMKEELIAQNKICLKVKEIIYNSQDKIYVPKTNNVPKTKSISNRIKDVTRAISTMIPTMVIPTSVRSNPVRVVYYKEEPDNKTHTISYYKDKPAIVSYDVKRGFPRTYNLEPGYPKCIGSNSTQTLPESSVQSL